MHEKNRNLQTSSDRYKTRQLEARMKNVYDELSDISRVLTAIEEIEIHEFTESFNVMTRNVRGNIRQ